ncbi:hypothetical protein VNO80_10140 [Phaseolus coccineus]|uniref:Transmembrane protein n=1 Tax=Phaseolus coccineus TaxID=3886 RepID=A0AAN9RJ61_PHACN
MTGAEEDPFQLCIFERRLLSSAQVLFTLFSLPPLSSLHFLFPNSQSIYRSSFFFFGYFHLLNVICYFSPFRFLFLGLVGYSVSRVVGL